MTEKETLLPELARCVLEMEDETVVTVAEKYIAADYAACEGIVDGLVKGMEKTDQLYEEEYFVPELLICSEAMYNGLHVLKPHLKKSEKGGKCPVIIDVVEGDTHDIGKNLVKIMMETAGFEVYDFGRDVAVKAFVEKAKAVVGDLIYMSTLMTTMENMRRVIARLRDEGIRNKFRVMVGGGPISAVFAEKIGAALCEMPFCHTVEAEALGANINLGDVMADPCAGAYRFTAA